ncbi:MAG TPA: M12 family metallopeptidase, partial [Longimicrobium sp.]|nr:M12 family metallopeptidase [Longimicrobium sp.]
ESGIPSQPQVNGDLDLPAAMFRSGEQPEQATVPMERRIAGAVNVDVQFTEVNGMAIYEGDIVLGTADDVRTAMDEGRGLVRVGEEFRWPGGRVAYVTVEAIRPRVEAAIRHWEERTPIRFVERTTEMDYISFEQRDGCWSRVGRQGGGQVISLADGCGLGAAIHEIGHALGLWHEQGRADRDTHVEVLIQNVIPKYRHNFDKHVLDGTDVGDYDHGSIMHYPATAFSANGQPTIRTRGGEPIGQRTGLSQGDIRAIRSIYPNLDWEGAGEKPAATDAAA